MNDADRKELMDLIAEYRTAVIVEGGAGRIRQLKRIVKHVEAVEAAAIERCAKALYGRLMRQDVGFEEAHLSLNVGGVPPTEHEFVEAIRALLPKEES